MFTIEVTHQIVANDLTLPQNLQNIYSPEVAEIVETDWEGMNTTFVVDDNLLSNCIRFRLANLPPVQQINYSPNILGEHENLMYFLKSVIFHHLRFSCISINFSISFVIMDSESSRFIYHSQNYYCLEVAHQIHDDDSKNHFFQMVENFDLGHYIATTHEILDDKYTNITLCATSIFFAITRQQ